jgi:KDO2-lipid IV(A) lauroyltransferase
MLPAALLRLGIPMASIYRVPDNPEVDALLRGIRRAATGGRELPLFPKGAAGARLALRHLAEGGVLGILADQKMNDGVAVPFMGHLAMTPAAPAALALRFRCPLIPGHVERLGAARFRLVVEPPLPLPDTGDRGEDLHALTLAINARLEAWIRARPAEWLWLHRRWPRGGGAEVSDAPARRAG